MRCNSRRFFCQEEISQIEERIRDTERGTSGEIVVVVTPQSSRYLDVNAVGGSMIGIVSAYALCRFFVPSVVPFSLGSFSFQLLQADIFLVVFLAVFTAVYNSFYLFTGLKRLFVSESRERHEIEKKAMQSFYNYGLHRTAQETGVLILISLMERKVYLLADRGVLSRIGIETLQAQVEDMIAGIRAGDRGKAVCDVIDSLGAVLKKEFPAAADNRNELSDRVIFE
jgi:putative membrane protein